MDNEMLKSFDSVYQGSKGEHEQEFSPLAGVSQLTKKNKG
jgi:hypothetical protein